MLFSSVILHTRQQGFCYKLLEYIKMCNVWKFMWILKNYEQSSSSSQNKRIYVTQILRMHLWCITKAILEFFKQITTHAKLKHRGIQRKQAWITLYCRFGVHALIIAHLLFQLYALNSCYCNIWVQKLQI